VPVSFVPRREHLFSASRIPTHTFYFISIPVGWITSFPDPIIRPHTSMRTGFLSAALASLVIASACTDAPTASEPAVSSAQLLKAASVGAIESSNIPSPYLCTTSLMRQGGVYRYRYGRFYLHFADGVARGTSTRQFRYTLRRANGEIAASAICQIPTTEAALNLTTLFFRLSPSQVHPQAPERDGGIQCGGSQDDACALVGVTSDPDALDEEDTCDPSIHFGCDDSTTSGGQNFWHQPTDPWGEQTGGGGSPDGQNALDLKDGNDCPPCGERAPSPAEKEVMKKVLSTIWCPDAQNLLSNMLTSGSILVYTENNGRYAEWDSDTKTIYINHGLHWNADGTANEHELADSMLHEAVHALLGHVNGQSTSETHGQAFLDKMSSCGFPQMQ